MQSLADTLKYRFFYSEEIHEYINILGDLPIINTNKRISYFNIPCAFDIETSSFYNNGEKVAIMYIWMLSINGYIILGRTWEDFIKVINELVDNMSFEEKDYMYKKIIESNLFDELRRKTASWLKIQHIPYKLIHTEQVPYTPLMRNFLYAFEFCRRRYVITDDLEFNIAGHYFDNDKFLFLLQHNFGIREIMMRNGRLKA